MGVPPVEMLLLDEMQPDAPTAINTASSPSIAVQLRQRRGARSRNSSASADPPAEGKNSGRVRFCAEVEVVWMVSVLVWAVVPFMVSEAGDRLHVGALLNDCGVTVQLSATVPEKAFTGVAVRVAVFPLVAPRATVNPAPLSENDGGPVTVTANVAVRTSEPETPVTVTVTGPVRGAELAAVSVIVLVLAAGLGEKLAVTPVGSPATESLTALVKPPDPVIWIVSAEL